MSNEKCISFHMLLVLDKLSFIPDTFQEIKKFKIAFLCSLYVHCSISKINIKTEVRSTILHPKIAR